MRKYIIILLLSICCFKGNSQVLTPNDSNSYFLVNMQKLNSPKTVVSEIFKGTEPKFIYWYSIYVNKKDVHKLTGSLINTYIDSQFEITKFVYKNSYIKEVEVSIEKINEDKFRVVLKDTTDKLCLFLIGLNKPLNTGTCQYMGNYGVLVNLQDMWPGFSIWSSEYIFNVQGNVISELNAERGIDKFKNDWDVKLCVKNYCVTRALTNSNKCDLSEMSYRINTERVDTLLLDSSVYLKDIPRFAFCGYIDNDKSPDYIFEYTVNHVNTYYQLILSSDIVGSRKRKSKYPSITAK